MIKNNRFHNEYDSKHFLEQLESIHHTRTLLLLFLLKVLSILVKKFSVRKSIFIIIFINAFHCSSETLHHQQSIILIKIRHSITFLVFILYSSNCQNMKYFLKKKMIVLKIYSAKFFFRHQLFMRLSNTIYSIPIVL